MDAAGEKTLACLSQGLARIVAEDGGAEFSNARLAKANGLIKSGVESLGEIVDALGGSMEEHGDAGFGAADWQSCEALACLKELESRGALDALIVSGEVLGDLVLGLGDELGGGGWCRGTEIGNKVGYGEIGFVAYGGDDGEIAGSDCSGDAFAVEGGEVFERSAAT